MNSDVHFSNFQDVFDRHDQWWRQERPDRPIVRLTCPSGVTDAPDWNRWDIPRAPEQYQEHIQRYIAHCSGSRFLADAFPHFYPNFAPGVTATMVHGRLEMGQDTAWVEFPQPWEKLQDTSFRQDEYWWRMCWQTVDAALEAGLVTAMPDLGGIIDVAAAVRGTENLLIDLIDSPAQVRQLIKRIRHLWFEWYDRFADRMFEMYGGITNRWGFFARGRHHPLQCDFAAMLGPKMFEQFVLPDLQATCERLDYAVYHLDGVAQIAHLDMLLSIPKIRLIQWVPGAGQPGTDDPMWFDMYKKIQAAGRGLVLGANLEQLEFYLNTFDPALLHLTVHVRSEEDVQKVLDLLDSHT